MTKTQLTRLAAIACYIREPVRGRDPLECTKWAKYFVERLVELIPEDVPEQVIEVKPNGKLESLSQKIASPSPAAKGHLRKSPKNHKN
jgi:hypothetical protein